jgi:hypothetical protein
MPDTLYTPDDGGPEMLELIPFTLMVFYLIPFLVASARGFDMPVAFLLANLVLGWTIIGWFVLLYAAMVGAGERATSSRYS